ncbi:MAG: ABC transporter permease [Planctomycetota bacterium]|nr:ABC transporter permease [Planctomycetota bacterium]
MLALKYWPVVFKHVIRHRTRTALTVLGVGTAMFLFAAVEALQLGMRRATEENAQDSTLVVYRENRYCPFTSRLPQYYLDRIANVPGVRSVVPMRIVVSNCRASLDVVTFRGVPPELFTDAYRQEVELVSGSLDEWRGRTDAALLGETLASRRGLRMGDRFDANGLTIYVAGIIRSADPQNQNVGYVHLDFLQYAPGLRDRGVVTQFNVKVDDPARMEEVAKAIDAELKNDSDPTTTRSEKAFVARAAADVLEIVRFTSWMGWGCLAAVLALVANAVVLSVQGRIRDHAVLQTLGFSGGLIARMIVAEGLLLSVLGGALGTGMALLALHWSDLSLSNEGLSINIGADPRVLLWGLAASLALGVLAGLAPAWQASRREIAACFRAV